MLKKYGGIWVDATTFMTNPLQELLGDNPNVRTFFALPYPWTDQSLKDNDSRLHQQSWESGFCQGPGDFLRKVPKLGHESPGPRLAVLRAIPYARPKDTRVSWIDHPQNWFLAAPSGDLFIHRLQQCVWQFMDGATRLQSSRWCEDL